MSIVIITTNYYYRKKEQNKRGQCRKSKSFWLSLDRLGSGKSSNRKRKQNRNPD